LIHFLIKNTLKNNHNHTFKHYILPNTRGGMKLMTLPFFF
jgi:hypothetical protein